MAHGHGRVRVEVEYGSSLEDDSVGQKTIVLKRIAATATVDTLSVSQVVGRRRRRHRSVLWQERHDATRLSDPLARHALAVRQAFGNRVQALVVRRSPHLGLVSIGRYPFFCMTFVC